MQSTHYAAAALVALGLVTALLPVRPAPVEQWRSRTIYQVVTDRFATADCWGEPCADLSQYCGGNFAGLRKMTGYIEEMGFDAVWWSPVTRQGPDALGGSGYHGYWPGDLYQVNPAFGTKKELQALVEHYHNRDMYVMFDMVINHMGYGDISGFNPFNKSTDFHDCNGCESLYCDAEPAWLIKPGGKWSNEHCKLTGLPDLNHSDPSVVARLISWFNYTQETYNPDGFRMDAAGHSLLDFCIALNKAVEPYTVGEILIAGNNKTTRDTLAEFVQRGGGDAVFAFPIQSALTEVFRNQKYDLKWLAEQRVAWIQNFGPAVHNMLLFADNHDVPRWLHAEHSSVSRFKNALTYILFMEGIPVIYYGTEQGLTDPEAQSDPLKPDSRPPLWTSTYQHDHPLWLFLKIAIRYRKLAAVWDAGLAVQHTADAHYLALSRGKFVIVLTDVGESGPPAAYASVQMVQDLPDRYHGRRLSNIFNPKDVLDVSPHGVGLYQPDPQGSPQVFYLGEVVSPESLYTPGPKVHDSSSTAVFCSFIGLTGLLLVLAALHKWITKHQSHHHLPKVRPSPGRWGIRSRGPNSAANHLTLKDVSSASTGVSPSESPHPSPTCTALKRLHTDGVHCKQCSLDGAEAFFVSTQSFSAIVPGSDKAKGPIVADVSKVDNSSASVAESSTLGKYPASQAAAAVIQMGGLPGVSSASRSSQGCKDDDGAKVASFHTDLGPLRAATGSIAPANSVTVEPAGCVLDSARLDSSNSKDCSPRSGCVTHIPRKSATSSTPRSVRFEVNTTATSAGDSTAGIASPFEDECAAFEREASHTMAHGGGNTSAPQLICHAALEYSMPSLGYTSQMMYGGMGMVVDTFIKHWPGPMALIAPLYKPCYAPPPAWSPSGSDSPCSGQAFAAWAANVSHAESASDVAAAPDSCISREMSAPCKYRTPTTHVSNSNEGIEDSFWTGGAGNGDTDVLCPSFVPLGQKQLISLSVDGPDGELVPVQVYKLETQVNGYPRVYYLIQSHVFSWREKTDIFSFNSEYEMLTWLAVFNKAVAAVVTKEHITHLQLHDYHAGLSLLYMREELRPAVMYVAHNAHYNAHFPVPTADRRKKVYACLNLSSKSCASYLEHHGNVDVLKPVVMHLRQQQQGTGVVAVSPRYAKQVCHKLSVFWQLTPLGRRNTITGILNSLDMSSSLAASGLDLNQVLAVKNTAKLQLQQDYGLAVGEQYIVLTFVGRMTQQKGCDIIAEVAGALMAKHPLLQMVVVGPTGDPVGASAIVKLNELSEQYPDRMYCPLDHYVSGPEKDMLLQATDFCLLPSRFEPCGLVDVEFGWSGALTIGHDTGGLGKMPGVYFTAQATHLSHLAQRFEVAVDKALSLSATDRHGMIAEALANRFPVDVMMSKYELVWLKIDNSYKQMPPAHSHLRKHQAHTEFFADRWIRHNKSHHSLNSLDQPTGSSTHLISRHSASSAINDTASLATISTWTMSQAAAASSVWCIPPCCGLGAWPQAHPLPRASSRQSGWLPGSNRTHRISECLLVMLQYFAMGPGMLLLTYLLMNEVAVKFNGDRCGFKLATDLLAPKGLELITASIIFFAVSTGMAPFWFYVSANSRPVSYTRLSALLALLSYTMTSLAMYTNQVFSLALGFAAATNMVASPLFSQGLLGQQSVDVFAVGRVFLALSEVTRCSLICACMALATAVLGPLPHQVLGGMCMLASAVILIWFCMPGALPEAYHHLSLRFKGQWRMLAHISCFWLSLLCSTCDTALLLINGYLIIIATQSLATFAAYQAVAYGACALAVLWNCTLLTSKPAELRLNGVVMVLAAMPGHMLLKAVVVSSRTSTGVLLLATAALDLVFSGRSSVMGLAGFLTLPSREVVCVWQFLAIMIGSGCVLATVGGGYIAQLAGATPNAKLLVCVIGGLEGLRFVSALVMARKYPRENLSAP